MSWLKTTSSPKSVLIQDHLEDILQFFLPSIPPIPKLTNLEDTYREGGCHVARSKCVRHPSSKSLHHFLQLSSDFLQLLGLGTEKKDVTWVVLNGVFSTKIKSQSDSIYQISALALVLVSIGFSESETVSRRIRHIGIVEYSRKLRNLSIRLFI